MQGGEHYKVWSEHEYRRYSAGHSYLKDGEQVGIPSMIAQRASRLGLFVKSTITWAKTATLPEPQKSRVSRQLEYVIHIHQAAHAEVRQGGVRTPVDQLSAVATSCSKRASSPTCGSSPPLAAGTATAHSSRWRFLADALPCRPSPATSCLTRSSVRGRLWSLRWRSDDERSARTLRASTSRPQSARCLRCRASGSSIRSRMPPFLRSARSKTLSPER